MNIEGIRDAGLEAVLRTECVGVSNVVHILRAAVDRLSSDEFGKVGTSTCATAWAAR